MDPVIEKSERQKALDEVAALIDGYAAQLTTDREKKHAHTLAERRLLMVAETTAQQVAKMVRLLK